MTERPDPNAQRSSSELANAAGRGVVGEYRDYTQNGFLAAHGIVVDENAEAKATANGRRDFVRLLKQRRRVDFVNYPRMWVQTGHDFSV